MELPQYTLHHTIKRMIIPRILLLFVLTPLFYVGIWINANLLGMEIPPMITVFIILALFVMVLVQGILNYVKFQKYRYLFYTNRVEYEGKKPATFLFTNFTDAKLKQNVFDKIFNTGSIQLSKSFTIGPISNVKQIKSYLEQLVQYYNYSQQRYRMQQQKQRMGQESRVQGAAQGTDQQGGQAAARQSVRQTGQTAPQAERQSSGQAGGQARNQASGQTQQR